MGTQHGEQQQEQDAGHDPGLARTAAGAFGWSFLNAALSRLGTLVVGVLMARILGPGEFGTFAVAMVALLAVLSFNELGVSLAVVRWERDPETVLGTVNAISTAGSVLLFLAMYATAGPVAGLLGAPDAAGIIRLMSVSVVFSGMVAGPAALLQRRFRQRRRLVIDQTVTWSGTGLSLALALGGFGAWSLAWGRVAATLIGVALFIHATRPYRLRVDRDLVMPLLRFGLPLAGTSIVVFAVAYVEQVAVGATLGATALGYFVLAFNLASWPLNMFSQPLRSVAPAVFSRLQGDPQRLGDSFTTLLRVVAVVTLPVCLVGAAVADDVIRFVYGDEWAPAAGIFAVLVLVTVGRIFVELSYDLLVVLQAHRSTAVGAAAVARRPRPGGARRRPRARRGRRRRRGARGHGGRGGAVLPAPAARVRPPDRAPGRCRAHPARRRSGRCRGRRARRAGAGLALARHPRRRGDLPGRDRLHPRVAPRARAPAPGAEVGCRGPGGPRAQDPAVEAVQK